MCACLFIDMLLNGYNGLIFLISEFQSNGKDGLKTKFSKVTHFLYPFIRDKDPLFGIES